MWIRRYIVLIILILFTVNTQAQQNNLIFLSHYLPESNLLNPAVQSPCKWYVGMPVLSSVHLNYGNSGFSYNQLFEPLGTDSFRLDIDPVVKRLRPRTFIGTEFHTQLFAIGYKPGNYYFNFSIIEKNNFSNTISRDLIVLAWQGNTPFEGREASFNGSGTYFTHYREYALGISRNYGNGKFIGLKGKLLFGKLNASTRRFDAGLQTDDITYNLYFEGDMLLNSSLPIIVDTSDGQITDIRLDENITPLQLLLNRKNWGVAFDAGFIYPYSDEITLSGSILDLGFIGWRSNLYNIEATGDFFYDGIINDTISETMLNDIEDELADSLNYTITRNKYYTFLPPRLTLGASYIINPTFTAGVNASAVIYRTKLLPSLTFSIDAEPINNLHIITGYNLQYGAYNNIGLGMVAGRGPAQFYMISDNMLGLIWPLSARNINLRFGLNLNLGCKEKDDTGGSEYKSSLRGNCAWIKEEKQYKKYKKKRK